MKPQCQFKNSGFPRTDCYFQAYEGRWSGYWPGDNENPRRPNLGCEYLIEAARERTKEMAVLGILLLASAWPAISMVVEVARFYRGHRH